MARVSIVGPDDGERIPFGPSALLLTAFTPDLYVPHFRDVRDLTAAGPPSPRDVEVVLLR